MRWMMLFMTVMLGSAQAAPCVQQKFETSTFTVCPFDASRQALHLMLPPSRGFTDLSSKNVAFGMNAGMFDTTGAPIGLYVENGAIQYALNIKNGSGNFYMLPNGIFSQDADRRLHIESTQSFGARHARPMYATQSGPMLLIAGSLPSGIAADGPSRNIRNGVCLRDSGRALFAISEEPVSFGRLARMFRSLACRDALYLDGFVSSLWLPSEQRMDHRALLGPLIVVTNR